MKWHVRVLAVLAAAIAFVIVLKALGSEDNSEDEAAAVSPAWRTSALWAEDQRPQLNPHRFKYLLNAESVCASDAVVDLLVMVASAVGHAEQREAIRGTWAALTAIRPYNVRVVFLLGQGKDSQAVVNEESLMFEDIVQEDFQDSYYNLTLKTVMGLKWSSIFCPQAKFVMKTDDDIFVNIPLLHNAITNEDFSKIKGCIKNSPAGSFLPVASFSSSDSVPALSPLRLPPAHPAFTAGAGYVLPGPAVQDLYLASLNTRLLNIEDVFTTGHCARRIGLHPPIHDVRFSCGEAVLNDCDLTKKFTGHRVTPQRQFHIWDALDGDKCRRATSR